MSESTSSSIPVYYLTIPIIGDALTVSASGDYHYGVRNVLGSEIVRVANKETDQHRNNILRIFTGDLIENALKSSVGHNYDISVPDPQDQKDEIIKILSNIMEYQYGSTAYNKLKIKDSRRHDNCFAVGVCGNHEYRSRKQSGQWIDRDIYGQSKILGLGMQAILEITIVNKKLKMQRTFKIYVAHRPNSSAATSPESIMRSIRKKRSDVPGCDLYVFGHFHKRFIASDGYFDSVTGTFKKVLYVINPSPMYDVEYADVAGYSPLVTGYHCNCYLPLDSNKDIYGIV